MTKYAHTPYVLTLTCTWAKTPKVTHTLGEVNTCSHTRPTNTGSQTHALALKCLRMHGVHTPMFVYSSMPTYTFHTFAHFRKFACPSSHTCIHICTYAHLLIHVYTHTYSCTLTMLTSIHTCTYTHSYRTHSLILILSHTHIDTLACSLILEHTNHAKTSHASTMGYFFHLFPHHPLLPPSPSLVSHFSGPITVPSWTFLVL